MNGFVLKMIEKNTKPPMWRRLYVPGGITFTQLSFILDDMFFLKHEDTFGFEFFSCKYQISERGAYHFKGSRWQYSQRNADDTYIDDYLVPEPWFSFYRETDEGIRAFRVEIEERLPAVELHAPQVIRVVTEKSDTVWRDTDINALLRERYTITYRKEPSYLSHAQLCKAAEENNYHFIGCSKPESAPMNSKDLSMREMVNHYLTKTGLKEELQKSLPRDGRAPLRDELRQSNSGLKARTENSKKQYYLKWIEKCDYVVGKLYGACPIEIFCQMCRANPSIHMTDDEIMALFHLLPEEQRVSVLQGRNIVTSSLLENGSYKNLQSWHEKDNSFYLPSEEEIKDLYAVDYPKTDPSYQRAVRLFRDHCHVNGADICYCLCIIFDTFSYGGTTSAVLENLDKAGFRTTDAKASAELLEILRDISITTRRAIYKGNRRVDQKDYWNHRVPEQSGSEERARLQNSRDFSKIYPNDPCPCGSGKKYKKCCGKR